MISKNDSGGRLKELALSKKVALFIFLIPVSIALGINYTPLTNLHYKYIAFLDPWNNYPVIWRTPLVVILVFFTATIGMKQWSYYYMAGRQGKAGFFVDTCACFNDVELFLDILLSFWGGVLFYSAIQMPGFWIFLLTLYSLLVYFRARITLKRHDYYFLWKNKGESAGPRFWTLLSGFPNAQIIKIAIKGGLSSRGTKDTWENRLTVMRDSLNWIHITAKHNFGKIERKLSCKEILSGWVWSHKIFFLVGIILTIICIIILYQIGPNFVSFLITVLSSLIIIFLFFSLSKVSEDWGANNFSMFFKTNK